MARKLWPWPEPRSHSLLKVGLAHLQRGEHNPAEELFRRAWALLEEDIWVRRCWHIPLLRARGKLAESVRLAETIGTPREVWLGKVFYRMGRDPEAEAQFLQAARTIEAIAAKLVTPGLVRSFSKAEPVLEVYRALGRRPLELSALQASLKQFHRGGAETQRKTWKNLRASASLR